MVTIVGHKIGAPKVSSSILGEIILFPLLPPQPPHISALSLPLECVSIKSGDCGPVRPTGVSGRKWASI